VFPVFSTARPGALDYSDAVLRRQSTEPIKLGGRRTQNSDWRP